ncbi:hypothetical protein CKO_01852 [Citrobacter koseri ATCC BAA-895]|uniref:Uncharacterized protein n=1 Tax=Citrobacter koseri (strain ATCC BAA-895 / CDC 4225-83 / SGSC4696) TaxID=290338 RepID=A8AHL8_CITK8|nr:hypothetical protein CKO_01852 [Citrobacter koseri ATCC BAA-895]
MTARRDVCSAIAVSGHKNTRTYRAYCFCLPCFFCSCAHCSRHASSRANIAASNSSRSMRTGRAERKRSIS